MISVDVGVCLPSNPRGLEALKRQLSWLDASSTSLLKRLNMESSFLHLLLTLSITIQYLLSKKHLPSNPRVPMGKVTGEEGWISLGPWGPRGSQRSRSETSYKADGPVMEMTVHYSQLSPVSNIGAIDAISFQSESCDGVLIGCSEIIGSSHGKMTQKVRINSSVEQLLSISLTYNTFYMTSLTFHTSRNKYGPIGPFDEKDTTFSMPMDVGEIVGFHGCGEVDRGNRLIAIGVFVAPKVKNLHSIQDPDDRPSKDKKIEEKQKSKIKELEDKVDEFVMKMKEADAKNEVLRKWNEEMEKAVVHLQKREEELKEEIKELKTESKELKLETIEVKKEIKEVEANNEVMRKKNKAMEKKVDDLQKIEEEFKIEIKELKKEMAAENELLKQRDEVMDVLLKQRNEVMSNIKVSGAIPLGPWGGQGGSFWVYKTNVTPIMEITLRYGEIIDSVLFRNYGRLNGDVVGCSDIFGGTGGHNHETISIDSSEEQLMSISLTTYNKVYISSLCFHSNRNSYGPFGRVRGPPVSIPIEEGAVLVGFHGRSGLYLDAIGVIVARKVLNS